MNQKVRDLEKVSFGIAIMFGIYWLYTFFIQQYLPTSIFINNLIGLIILYGIGLVLFMFVIKDIDSQKYQKNKISFKTITFSFLLQCSAMLVLIILVNVLLLLGVNETSTDINSTSPAMIFMLLIFNPIVEEFVFRKLIADKLLKYGEAFYILVSSYCFAILHGISIGFVNIIYTFILGLIWSYLLVKTGSFLLVVFMHAISNLFNAIIMQILLSISIKMVSIYMMIILVLGIIGLILFIINRKKIIVDNKVIFSDKTVIKDVISNKGILFYTILTLIFMVLK